jgi:DNA polymerase bacteriophage-type
VNERLFFMDTETFSTRPISVGIYAYAEMAEVTLFAYKFRGDKVLVWEPAIEPIPAIIASAMCDPNVIWVAHNAQFDRVIVRECLGIDVPIKRWRCSMACAMSLGLPGALERLGQIVQLEEDQAKLKDSKALVMKFCKPAPKNHTVRRYDRTNSPEDWARFKGYCAQDVVALEALWDKLPKWNYTLNAAELASWHLDQEINDRGVMIDRAFVDKAVEASAKARKVIDDDLTEATVGILTKVTKRDPMIDYLNDVYDLDLHDLKGSTVEELLKRLDLPKELEELLLMRIKGVKTSTAKYKRMAAAMSVDDYARGLIRWCGALRTGRFSGSTVQPHNFPRPEMKYSVIEAGIEATMMGCEDFIFGQDTLTFFASALRSALVAPKGYKLCVADLSNIEGRMLAWLAGEKWKLDAFRTYDTFILDEFDMPIPDGKGDFIRKGHDLYRLAYARAFQVPPESVVGNLRQIGKVMELGLGYEGGVGAFIAFALGYNMDLDELVVKGWDTIPEEILGQAIKALEWAKKKNKTYGLYDEVYVVCDSLKRMWRLAHPEIVTFWKELDNAFRIALSAPGERVACRKVNFLFKAPWLAIQLPSGRLLTYYQPRIGDDNSLSYLGINQFTRQWRRVKTYSGKIAENITQAAARDVLVSSMQPAEDRGYLINLTVHDEIISTAPDTPQYTAQGLAEIMATNQPWNEGLPLAAAGFSAYRYRKG